MLCALAIDYEGSERYYRELQAFARRCGRQDAAGKQARSRLAWLDISLPQRGVNGLTETFPAVFRLMCSHELALPSFSVTSTLPSIMNGGEDFSEWSKRDDLLYKTLRVPVEAVLGKDGVGLADCAIAESKFEKGEDISARMLALIPMMSEIRLNGTPDMEFAMSGLLARSQLAGGQPGDARRTVETLRALCLVRSDALSAEYGRNALPRRAAHRRSGRRRALVPGKGPARPHAPERHAALPISYAGHDRACIRRRVRGADDARTAGAVLRELRAAH